MSRFLIKEKNSDFLTEEELKFLDNFIGIIEYYFQLIDENLSVVNFTRFYYSKIKSIRCYSKSLKY